MPKKEITTFEKVSKYLYQMSQTCAQVPGTDWRGTSILSGAGLERVAKLNPTNKVCERIMVPNYPDFTGIILLWISHVDSSGIEYPGNRQEIILMEDPEDGTVYIHENKGQRKIEPAEAINIYQEIVKQLAESK